MIVSEETTDEGQVRFYFTRQHSIVSFITDDGEGRVQIHVEPSEFACPWTTTPEKMAAVKMSLLEEAARRFSCKVDEVGTRPGRRRWKAHDLYLVMRRHRHAHPAAAAQAGTELYSRRAEEARRIIRRLKRRGFKTQPLIARALNARGLTTPGRGRPWTARTVSRILAAGKRWRLTRTLQ
jgi:hypothetical protein